MTHSSFLLRNAIFLLTMTRYSLAELFLQLVVVGELGARLLRHADTGLAILKPVQCCFFPFQVLFQI